MLGLDGSKYNVGRIYDDDQDEEFTTLESQISDVERFKDAERLRIRCNLCQHEQIFEGMTRKTSDNEMVSGLECGACHGTMSEAVVRSALIRCMRSYIRKYYEGWLVCDDATCSSRTRMMSVFGRRCLREGCYGSVKREVIHVVEGGRAFSHISMVLIVLVYSTRTSNYIHSYFILATCLIPKGPRKMH